MHAAENLKPPHKINWAMVLFWRNPKKQTKPLHWTSCSFAVFQKFFHVICTKLHEKASIKHPFVQNPQCLSPGYLMAHLDQSWNPPRRCEEKNIGSPGGPVFSRSRSRKCKHIFDSHIWHKVWQKQMKDYRSYYFELINKEHTFYMYFNFLSLPLLVFLMEFIVFYVVFSNATWFF